MVILIFLLGASSGAHGLTFFPTALGLGGLAGKGEWRGEGLMSTRLGLGRLSLHNFSLIDPSSATTGSLQLFVAERSLT